MPKSILYRPSTETTVPLPLYSSRVSAGFPSPADDFIEDTIDLNSLLIRNKPATYLLRVVGDSMQGAAINEGDILIVDASLPPQHNKIVIAAIDGEFVVKRFVIDHGQTYLKSENPNYSPILITKESDTSIFGVVTGVVREVK